MDWGLGLRSRLLVAAGAALLMGPYAHTPAKAADLGGDCCSDLEDRVAELEATTVRKGNKKVSVTLYGQVNRAILWWDDHVEKGTYAGIDNNYESSRFGLKGSAKIAGDWSGGYRLEVEPTFANSARLNQFNDDNANDPLGPMNVRHSFIYLNNKQYGEVRLGLTATPIYNITKDTNVTELEDTMHSDDRMNQSFFLRAKASPKNAEGLSTIRWSDISRCFESSNAFVCSTRKEGAAYWSPTWQGFSASWGYFEDSEWGTALRYRGSFTPFGGGTGLSKDDTFQVGAGIGYAKLRDERLQTAGGGIAGFERDIDEWGGSASIKHVPTGLFVFSAFSINDTHDSNAIGAFNGQRPPEYNAWDVQFGIQREIPWFGLASLGETSIWGGISQINDGFAQGSSGVSGTTVVFDNHPTTKLGAVPANGLINATTAFPGAGINGTFQVVSSEVDRWQFAVDQELAKANMHLYWVYQHFDSPELGLIDKNLNHVSVPLEGFDLFYTGARIYF
jgi:predicted porin